VQDGRLCQKKAWNEWDSLSLTPCDYFLWVVTWRTKCLCHHNPWAYLIWRTELPLLWRPSHLTCWSEYGRKWTVASMCALWRRVHTSNICRHVS
jgi:hypothetical protein